MVFYMGVDFVVLSGMLVDVVVDGVVLFVGIDLGGYGCYVIVDYVDGYLIYYVYLFVFVCGFKIGEMVK